MPVKSDKSNWFKDAIIYQAHVRSFRDSNGDGIGDFKGMIGNLDYLKSLGVNALWLLPFYRSPLRDGGYDIADFTRVHEDYGTVADFRRLIREAHNRDIRVITELVLNHTSNEHEWFKRARKSKPGSINRDFYVWSDNTERYSEARIIFQDFETSNWSWDSEAQAYYWHRFYSHQPDLNFDNPKVHQAVFKVLDFWFGMGVDGLRLDAVPYLYERDDTNCENLPETHTFLKELRKYIDDNFKDKMLLAEANQWPEDASAYFGKGDECHMAFHFPLMPRLYMSLKMEDRFPLIDILEQTPELPEGCQWAIFLRNHDELTLEMVSDEERDYMYKSFAQDPKQRINLGIRRRLSPLLNNDRKSIELLNILLFSLPGTPIVYYGDEIGMGDNFYLGDRDGVRTPMQWSADRNAGFSSADPQRLFLPLIYNHDYHFESVNVENQDKNSSSLLWWMRRVIAKRKQYKAFSRGKIEFIDAQNSKIVAFTRTLGDEIILVIVNLSRYSQQARLDLRKFAGYIPVEVFSRNEFTPIGEQTYMFPMQFKNYFWFELRKPTEEEGNQKVTLNLEISFTEKQWNQMGGPLRESLRGLMIEYVQKNRWFRGKSRKTRDLEIIDTIPFDTGSLNSYGLITRVKYIEGKDEYYFLPVSVVSGEEGMEMRYNQPGAVIAQVNLDGREALMVDGTYIKEYRDVLFRMIHQRQKSRNRQGAIAGMPGKLLTAKVQKNELPLPSRVFTAEQSNTSLLFDQRFFLKLYRSPEEGKNPELDILRALTEHTSFSNFPVYAGSLEYRSASLEDMSLGILVNFVQNEGNAWDYTQNAIENYFEKIRRKPASGQPVETVTDVEVKEMTDPFFLEMIRLLGKRTAEMHKALASISGDKDFIAEPFSLLYQKSLYQGFRTLIKRTIQEMKQVQKKLDKEQQELLGSIFDHENLLLSTLKQTLEKSKIHSSKIRVHGDYHLGQVLFTGKDFIIIDFEGEPTRSLTARSLKYCPFKDVAGMLRSFHYAIYMGQIEHRKKFPDPETEELLVPWLEPWYATVSELFLEGYLESARQASFVPEQRRQLDDLLSVYTIEKAIYEADYELNNRPDWLHIPLNGLNSILENLVKSQAND